MSSSLPSTVPYLSKYARRFSFESTEYASLIALNFSVAASRSASGCLSGCHFCRKSQPILVTYQRKLFVGCFDLGLCRSLLNLKFCVEILLLFRLYHFNLLYHTDLPSVNPLEVFIYREGFGRFSTQPYTLDPNDKTNKYIHLTNVSINKYNLKNYDCDATDRIYGGSKVSLATLRKTFKEDFNIDWESTIWQYIKSVCLKALVAAQNDIQYNPCCFDLYGFDVIIDEDLKCWLLEINSSPSFACDTVLDDMIKQRLVDDTIDLISPIDFDRKRLFEVLERRTQEEFGGAKSLTNQHYKRSMNRDLTYILHGQMPRAYGEMPKNMGNFERLAPCDQSEQLLKLIGGYKMFGSAMKLSEKIPQNQKDKIRGIGSMPALSEKGQQAQVMTTPKAGSGSATNNSQRKQTQQISMKGIEESSSFKPLLQ